MTTEYPPFAFVMEQRRRSHMEDWVSIDTEFLGKGTCCIFGGVYDGHGGQEGFGRAVTLYAAGNMPRVLRRMLDTYQPLDALSQAYLEISRTMPLAAHHGACAANFLMVGDTIYHANAGDCCILVLGETARQLSAEHRMFNPREYERIVSSGGKLYGTKHYAKGGTALMPTRSLGDSYFNDVGHMAQPSTGSYSIIREDMPDGRYPSRDRYLLLASDGLMDMVDNDQILSLSRQTDDPLELATRLKALVEGENGYDNIAILIVSL